MTKHKELVFVTFIIILLACTPLHADRILVIGDSWAEPIGNQLQRVLNENEHTDTIVEITPIIYGAKGLATPEKLGKISTWLEEWPDTNIVQMSIGTNDWLSSNWVPSHAGTALEEDLITEIIGNVEIVVDHIFSVRPGIKILWASCDFPRPHFKGTPAQINTYLITMADQMAQFAMTKPGLDVVDMNGALQLAFGFDGIKHTVYDPGFVIPPGDPSLPDPGFPSPFKSFFRNTPWHPNSAGYKALAQAQYDGFYGPLLDAPVFEMNAGLNDAWFYPETDGQGFFITVFPDLGYVSMAWFTYDTELPPIDATAKLGDPGHRWLTAVGPIEGNQVLMNIELTSGGIFDASSNIIRTDPPGSDGTILLTFDSCSTGTVEYDIPSINRNGIVPIQRVAGDNIVICEALSAD